MKKTITAALIVFAFLYVAISAYTVFFPVSRGAAYTTAKTVIQEPYLPLGGGRAVINLNTSSLYILQSIPYIGNKSDEIIKLRSELGGFVSIEQIALINGIGLKNFLRIKPYIRAD